tara:strand:+ start:208 stop:387 length:180 start_codon:yes stop_codon:yes gene_type:complete
MKIYKTYKDKIDWFETNEQELVEYTENRGYFFKDTALQVLKDCGSIQTPWAIWSLTKNL